MSKELAADYFARHTSNECHITSDGRVFHTKGSADSFANGLKDNKVESYTRESKEQKPKEETKVFTLEELNAFDSEKATYAELKDLVKALKLESASQKQVDLVAAFEAYKAVINTEIKD